jgi:mRNA-capping enzyme
MEVVRVPLRFVECKSSDEKKRSRTFTYGGLLPLTVFDGELVVDKNPSTGSYWRRFLLYDVICYKRASVSHLPFRERFTQLKELVRARNKTNCIYELKQVKFGYDYDKEPFSVRLKKFYELNAATKLLDDLIPNLGHESDGLIFQGGQDHYVSGSFDDLLKWKFVHLNSVDLLLRVGKESPVVLFALNNQRNLSLIRQEILLPNIEDPLIFDGQIVECAYDQDLHKLVCIRMRPDKSTPNKLLVYYKVLETVTQQVHQRLFEILEMSSPETNRCEREY